MRLRSLLLSLALALPLGAVAAILAAASWAAGAGAVMEVWAIRED